MELDYKTTVGPGLVLQHAYGLVVHQDAIIGANCLLRQGVTLGERVVGGAVPILESGVQTGANALILGGVRIGHSSIIGAGAVVLDDVAPFSVVAGNPAVVIKNLRSA